MLCVVMAPLTDWMSWVHGIGAVEAFALLLIPSVIARGKEPSSTMAWILALLFLPGIGATLYLLFGRDRIRLPVQWKREADKLLEARRLVLAKPSLEDKLELSESTGRRSAPPIERELFRVGLALSGVEPTVFNRVEVLNDGNATYEALAKAIDGAKHYIHAEYYLVRRGKTASFFRDRLIAAARRGVRVKLLVDGYGSFWLTPAWLSPLRAAGAKVAFFLPARLLFLQPMNLRNHRKIVVVDGQVGFTGGINIGDEYRGERAPWRDVHLRLEGPCVSLLNDVFARDWHFVSKSELVDLGVQGVDSPACVRPGNAKVAIVQSGPDAIGMDREAVHHLLFSAITLAQSRIYITTPYFIPDRSIVVALETAALRGVDVRLLLPSKNNHPSAQHAGRSFYESLLDAGVRVYEYGPGMIHAKTMVVDGRVALVGSANMDLRSFRLNFEVHAAVQDADVAEQVERAFLLDIAVSNEVNEELFKARPLSARILQGTMRFLSPLM